MNKFQIKCLVVTTFHLLVASTIPAVGEQPNILLILADDASRDSFGAYGCEYIKTPGFDDIAAKGVLFQEAYVCNPKCAPARACLLTGRYSWQLEEACNHNPYLSDKWKFYPWLLKESGYHIGFTGKGWGPGVWQGAKAGNDPVRDNPAGPPFSNIKTTPPYSGINKIDYVANFEQFIESGPEKAPFCFWMGVKEPHRRYQLDSWKLDGRDLSEVSIPAYYPDNDIIRGDLADYAIEVEWFDKQIVGALEVLKSTGKLKNTIIIVTSDHGMPFPRVKGQVYEDGFRVPFAVRWDEKITAGRKVTDFITFPDFAPTLLEIAGVERHPQMTGKSFSTQLFSTENGRIDPQRNYTLLGKERHDIGRTDGELFSVGYPVRAIRNDHFLYIRNFLPERWPVGDPELDMKNTDGSPTKDFLTSLPSDSEDYLYYSHNFGKRPEEELYDIVSDPDCVNNLAKETASEKTKTALWAKLKAELMKQGDPRLLGEGDIFDYYPNAGTSAQRKLYRKPDYDPIKIYEQFKQSQ